MCYLILWRKMAYTIYKLLELDNSYLIGYNVHMFSEFIQTKVFSKKWDQLGFTDDDLRLLEVDLLENQNKYPVIKGTGGLRKCRVKLRNKGKSGGARVLYVNFIKLETIYLITVYAKNEQEDITESEKEEFKILINELEEEVKKLRWVS